MRTFYFLCIIVNFSCVKRIAPEVHPPGMAAMSARLSKIENFSVDGQLLHIVENTYDAPINRNVYQYSPRASQPATTENFDIVKSEKRLKVRSIRKLDDQDRVIVDQYLLKKDNGEDSYLNIKNYKYLDSTSDKFFDIETTSIFASYSKQLEKCSIKTELLKECEIETTSLQKDATTEKYRTIETKELGPDFEKTEINEKGKLTFQKIFSTTTFSETQVSFDESGVKSELINKYNDAERNFLIESKGQNQWGEKIDLTCRKKSEDTYECEERSEQISSNEITLTNTVFKKCKNYFYESNKIEYRQENEVKTLLTQSVGSRDANCNSVEVLTTPGDNKKPTTNSIDNWIGRRVTTYDEYGHNKVREDFFDLDGNLERYSIYSYEN